VGGRVPRATVAGRVATGTARERVVPPRVPLAVAIRGLRERRRRVRVRGRVRVPLRLPHHDMCDSSAQTRENLLGTPGEVRRPRSPARRVRSTRAVPPPRDTRVRSRGGNRAEPAARKRRGGKVPPSAALRATTLLSSRISEFFSDAPAKSREDARWARDARCE
jgi:hypothetical protein